MGVSPREFVEFRQVATLPNGIALLASSCIHAGAPSSDNVRGDTAYMGYVFRNVDGAFAFGNPVGLDLTGSKKRCYISGFAKQSYGGNLPHALINKVNSMIIGEWCEHFRNVLLSKIPSIN